MDHNKLWKILKQMRIPGHLTCLLRNLYAGQEATVRSGQEQQTGSKSGKEYIKAVYCHPAYLAYAEYIMRNAGLEEALRIFRAVKLFCMVLNDMVFCMVLCDIMHVPKPIELCNTGKILNYGLKLVIMSILIHQL